MTENLHRGTNKKIREVKTDVGQMEMISPHIDNNSKQIQHNAKSKSITVQTIQEKNQIKRGKIKVEGCVLGRQHLTEDCVV